MNIKTRKDNYLTIIIFVSSKIYEIEDLKTERDQNINHFVDYYYYYQFSN